MLERIRNLMRFGSETERFRDASPTLPYQPVTLRKHSIIRGRRRIFRYLLGAVIVALGYGRGASSARAVWLRGVADRLQAPKPGPLKLAGHTDTHANHPHRDSDPPGFLTHLDTQAVDLHSDTTTTEEPKKPPAEE